MNLTEARSIVAGVHQRDYDVSQVDNAIKYALTETIRQTKCSRTTGSLALTANIAEASTSSLTDFLPERLLYSELTYPDQGAWETGTSYAVNDIVIGDGDPDALYYRCKTAHTSGVSSEPPNTTYWEQVSWPQRFDLQRAPYRHIADRLTNRLSVGRPEWIAFRVPSTAVVAPAPDASYTVRLTYYQPLVTWTSGTESPGDVTINIPDEYVRGSLLFGAAAALLAKDPADIVYQVQWRQFQNHINQVRAAVGMGGIASDPGDDSEHYI